MVELFRSLDEDDILVPKFLAEVLATHIVELLSEVACLRLEMTELKKSSDYLKTDNLTDVKEELHDIKNILLKKNFVNDIIATAPATSGATSLSDSYARVAKQSVPFQSKVDKDYRVAMKPTIAPSQRKVLHAAANVPTVSNTLSSTDDKE
jgi:hypothetical protein